MAKRVSVQAIVATATAAGLLTASHDRRYTKPEMHEAPPTTPAIKENITKNPVAAFPIGK